MKTMKTKSFALVIMAILLTCSALSASTIMPAKAQTVPAGVTMGSMQVPSGQWATTIPAGVTPNSTVTTFALISASPTPAGVGQQLLINVWTETPLQTTRYHSGYYVTIVPPSGSNVTVGPFSSFQGDTTAYFNYVPSQVGTYTFQFYFAGNYYPAGWYFQGVIYPSQASITPAMIAALNPFTASFSQPVLLQTAYYKPSLSPPVTVTVQKSLVAGWPPAPLPGTDANYYRNGYWTFPISIDNREWWSIAGQYPWRGEGGGSGWPANTNTYASNYAYTAYVQGPTSAHMVWEWQGGIVGIAGGQYGYRSIGSGETNYAGVPSIIYQGRCYQTVTVPAGEMINGTYVTEPTSVWECYSLYTGQVYWQQTGITQPPTVVSQNEVAGSEPGAGQTGGGTGLWYLMYIGSRLIKYDPIFGAVSLNISIAPITSGTFYDDPFVLSVQSLGGGNYALINWTTDGADPVFADRIISNISWPFTSLGTDDFQADVGVTTLGYTPAGADTTQEQWVEGASLVTGQLLFNVSVPVAPGTTTPGIFFSTSTGVADHGMYAVRCLLGYWDCWYTTGPNAGKLAWQTPKTGDPGGETYPWGDFGAYTIASYGGLLYDFSYAGFYALNWTNGDVAWHFADPCLPFEGPWYPTMSLFAGSPQIANGILYYANGEHSPTEPLARGWYLYALNATTGQVIWDSLDGGPCGPVSGGYLTFGDNDNGYLEVYGPGISATTVSATQTAVTAGTPVLIAGTVMDQSPAQPNTACVSDSSMTTWMAYLHDQQPLNGIWGNATVSGVPVTLSAIASDGSSVTIGTVTSDVPSGTFGYTWTPTTTGLYKIVATFAGDDSYGASSAMTYATVVAAPVVTSAPTPVSIAGLATTSSVITYIVIAVVAIIIAIAIATALMLRKRP